jgi:hypothetical protein
MSLIKKIDVPKYLAARRRNSQLAARFVIQPQAAVVSSTEPARAKSNAAAFREGFSLEHPSLSVIVPGRD